jgi:hypothetical protein
MVSDSNLVGPLLYGLCGIFYLWALHRYVKSSTRRWIRKSVKYYSGTRLTPMVETVCLSRYDVRISYPECKTPYFAWRLDKHEDSTYRLVYGYQTGFSTVIIIEHWFCEADLYGDEVIDKVTYCRKQMEKVLI